MSKHQLLNWAIAACGILFILIQVFVSLNIDGFTGTDDQSVEAIKNINPEYTPWVKNVLEHSQDWMETVLFAVQGSLGIGVIIFYILRQRNKKQIRDQSEK